MYSRERARRQAALDEIGEKPWQRASELAWPIDAAASVVHQNDVARLCRS
jgi:hypothetical protein